ncbi:hypothetical protein TNCV_956991 [Trichonephila clavipes]|nr:hypothetical protein TNCV_956991 [Trichonephila clavipes]
MVWNNGNDDSSYQNSADCRTVQSATERELYHVPQGKATHPVVPQIFFGILAAIGGFLVLFLPETNNCSVPDTFRDMVEISRKGHPEKKTETVLALQEVDKKELTE